MLMCLTEYRAGRAALHDAVGTGWLEHVAALRAVESEADRRSIRCRVVGDLKGEARWELPEA